MKFGLLFQAIWIKQIDSEHSKYTEESKPLKQALRACLLFVSCLGDEGNFWGEASTKADVP